ncbi:SRPBCC family protein [Acidobacteria bacterium AB60]|nr:SRPBCC family protein [Acidobacteria bacterium AB60]
MANTLKEAPRLEPLPRIASAAIIEDGRYLPPPADGDGQTWVRTSTLIQSTPEECYRLWRDLPNVPRWQELMKEVRVTGPNTSHWVMEVNGKTMEWDSEILKDEPGKRIAWRSTGGSPQNAGEVIFDTAAGGRGTIVTILQEFGFGRVSSATATVLSRNPKQAVIENLRHFKALVETGEIPTIQGQSHGPRGVSGKLKASLYGEHVPTPRGDLQRAS